MLFLVKHTLFRSGVVMVLPLLIAFTLLAGEVRAEKPKPAAKQSQKEESAKPIFKAAFDLYKEGQFEAAELQFKKGLEVDPKSAIAHYYLAETQARLNKMKEALKHYETVVKFAPDSKEAALATVALEKGREAVKQEEQQKELKKDMVHIKLKFNNTDFWIDKYEVTQGDFKKVMGSNPSKFTSCGGNCPVEQVTWHEATEYCKKAGKRLPTEVEWEIAALGSREVKYATGSGELDCTNANWGRWDYDNGKYRKCTGAEGPVAVGNYAPNAIGLYDMTGNVWEWTSSPHEKGGYVLRGGGWSDSNPEGLAVSYRYGDGPGKRDRRLGFRCAQ